MRIAAELHCHTCHSDASFLPEELAEAARAEELDVIAMTDHNTTSAWLPLEKTGIPFIHGIEWTTFFGHMLALGCDRFVDWRDATPDTIDRKMLQVHQAGGLVGIAHPFAPGSPMCTGCYWDFRVQDWTLVNYIEVWSEEFPSAALHNQRAVRWWISLLDQGFRIAPSYGRDWHVQKFLPVPFACTYLEAEAATESAALDALRGGRTLLSLGPDLEWQLETPSGIVRAGDEFTAAGAARWTVRIDWSRRRRHWDRFKESISELRLLAENGRVLAVIPLNGEPDGILSANVDLTGAKYARLEAHGTAANRECMVALSAPAYARG